MKNKTQTKTVLQNHLKKLKMQKQIHAINILLPCLPFWFIDILINRNIIIVINQMFIRPKLDYSRQDLAGVSLRAPSAQLGRGECSFFVKDTQTYTHTLNRNLYIIIIIAVAAPDITAFCQKLGLEKLLSMLIKQLKGTFPLKILCPNALI